jgi:hypothetical protein
MIMTQEQAFLKAQGQLTDLIAFVQGATPQGLRLDEVERGLFSRLLQLGLSLLWAHIAAQGDGDLGETTTTPDGQTCRRLPQPHARTYRSVFGPLVIGRFVYGSREGQQIAHVPLDARLGMPEGEFSYLLQDWAQRLCLKGAFAEAAQSLHDLLGLRHSVRSLEHMSQAVADSAAAFAHSRPTPPADEEGELLVFTADGKGVPMRRPVQAGPRQHPRRRGKGEKANKKQMAYVGAAYTIAPFVRTAEQVVQELRAPDEGRAARPRPCHKHVWAEMTQVREGETHNGRVALFAHLAAQRQRRDPSGGKPTVCLFDGEQALWQEWLEGFSDTVGILDLFHVLERLWDAAYCFHPEKSREAEAFVTARLRLLLEGKVGGVIRGLRQMRTKHGLRGPKAKTLTQVANYLESNRDFMRYDEYLAAGYPIGSGVAEGACRHLVKDRLEQTGMRWSVAGAQAMLHVRATYLNGEWEAFWEHRIAQEQRRLYGPKAAEPNCDMAV